MLVLSRKEGEQIHIGPDIVVTVTEILGGKVRIGISAPPGLKVFRKEISPYTTRPITPGEIKAALGKVDAPLEDSREKGLEVQTRTEQHQERAAPDQTQGATGSNPTLRHETE